MATTVTARPDRQLCAHSGLCGCLSARGLAKQRRGGKVITSATEASVCTWCDQTEQPEGPSRRQARKRPDTPELTKHKGAGAEGHGSLGHQLELVTCSLYFVQNKERMRAC